MKKQQQVNKFDWEDFDLNEYVEEKPVTLTKAIAAQIVQSDPIILSHPAKHYVVSEKEKLPAGELTRVKGLWTSSYCMLKWNSLPGADQIVGLQARVEAIKQQSAVFSVKVGDESAITTISKDGETTKYSIIEEKPIVVRDAAVYEIYNTAAMYFLANPPFTGRNTICTNLEAEGSSNYVPPGTAMLRKFSDGKWVGPFEEIYVPTPPPTIPKIEAVMHLSAEPARVVNQVSAWLAKHYNGEKSAPHQRVFTTEHPIGFKRQRMPKMISLSHAQYWVQMKYFERFGRVSGAYDPFMACVLSNGDARRVHIMQNLMFAMNQAQLLSVDQQSASSTWSFVKHVASMNIPVRDSFGLAATPEDWQGSPGVFNNVGGVLRIVDLPGQVGVTIQGGVPVFSPANPGAALKGIEGMMPPQEGETLGVVAYFHPTLFREGWGAFPIDMSVGKIIMIRGVEGWNQELMLSTLCRFWQGRMMFPYTRVTWPRMAGYFDFSPVVLKNGRTKEAAEKLVFEYEGEDEIAPMDYETILESFKDLPAQYPIYAPSMPMPIPAKLAPEPVFLAAEGMKPLPKEFVPEIPAMTFSFEQETDEEAKKSMQEREQARKAQAAQLEADRLAREAKKKKEEEAKKASSQAKNGKKKK